MIAGVMLNGEYIEGNRLAVEADQPYFAHGTGLFETLRCHRGRPCFLAPHVERMRETALKLSFECPIDTEQVERQIALLLEKTGFSDARVRFHLLVRNDGRSDFLVTAEPVEPMVRMGEPTAIGLADERFNGAAAMSGLKTMNYMVNRLAEAAGAERGYSEVVFTRHDGCLLEGTRSTVFFVRDGVLETPGLDIPILPGVTRGVILDIARARGITVREGRYRFDDVVAAEEVFLTGSVGGIRPVSSVEGREIPCAPGPVTEGLADAYWDLATGATE